ncbi:Stk1 family PASTA domain-containing Ser/Thr kinase [Arthrobacter cryoconiti]|uniref:non-specific serine/threonine protein kinase n=1 Tax=Arthrobacter cryoconiti TaxID=748907 RepID=A0ABV8R0W7_9MICC|nr:Stk1 family PASTA domain-containing Ser/Thr kinase [Arthrobacter cryoconiti]MCC9069121.1 Stk1 family PASTA domain-containing Ser/Thr kinase [Arthrobacter cryoconiti]
MQDVPHDPLIGSTVDNRYLVLSKVARGGMSTVYLATDIRLNRNIALKILHPHLAMDDAFIERLKREAWSAASLSHPHVVQIHDHGVSTEHAYLVLEYIHGQTLRDLINARGPMTPRQALQLLDPIVEGLAAAHGAGLVHRDVKPENVLLDTNNWVKIGDFGLSRAVTTTTNTAPLMGTVGYIAPELVTGSGGDARSDIYSAGIILYELLTGSQPFEGDVSFAVAMAHVRDEVPRPSAAIPGLPAEMDELVSYMCAKDPDNRPANGSALLEDLRHIRSTLTPAELDSGGAFAEGTGAGFAGQDGAECQLADSEYPTTVLDRGYDHDATSAQASSRSTSADMTTLIPTHTHPTSVLPGGRALYVEEPAEPAPLSKQQKRTEAKALAKSAAIPVKKLGPAHPRRRAAIWITVVAVLAVLLAYAGWFLALGPGALTTVPEVHNKTVAQAQASLHAEGFDKISTTDVYDESVAVGLVVNTDPANGASQRRFLGVTLMVSKGPVMYSVPDLGGKTLADAKVSLVNAHLDVGPVTEAYDAKVPAGTVVSQDPASGLEFRGGTKINLVVSKGPQPIAVPSVVGKTSGDAQAAIKAVGLLAVVAPEQVNSATVPAGAIVAQSPESGELPPGSSITLTVSKGPKMVMVPDVVGKQVGAATAQLKALGFDVQVKNLLGGFFGTVRFQDPQGVNAPEGSTVTLQVI